MRDIPIPNTNVLSPRTAVSVGIIRDTQQRIFITRRRQHTELAGCWEFPGGKLEAGETPLAALIRELNEEIGIQVEQAQLLQTLEGVATQQHLQLNYFLVEQWQGEPYGREGQPSAWVDQQALQIDSFPPTNAPIIKLLLADQV